MHADARTGTHAHTDTRTDRETYSHTHTHIKNAHTDANTQAHTDTHAEIDRETHSHTNTNTHTHVQKHTQRTSEKKFLIRRHHVASAQLNHINKDTYAQPSEPILFPKLRIHFADFPYLLFPIDQRLLTLET